MNKVPVGILGCGAIAPTYLDNLTRAFFGIIEVVACADSVAESARKCAVEFGVTRACAPEELLADRLIELVINHASSRAPRVVTA